MDKLPGCGGHITVYSSGVLTLPVYPHSYPVPFLCEWTLTSPNKDHITLQVGGSAGNSAEEEKSFSSQNNDAQLHVVSSGSKGSYRPLIRVADKTGSQKVKI